MTRQSRERDISHLRLSCDLAWCKQVAIIYAQFQALPRPDQKRHLVAAHEEGIGPRTLSRLTGVPYSVVQRATTSSFRYDGMVSEPLPEDKEYETYIDDSENEEYPEY